MIGIVIVTHVKLGDALIEAAEFIMGSLPEATAAVSIDLKIPADKLRNKIKDAIKKVDRKKGVLVLTDMFGGTPSNLSYSFLEEGRIEVISGVNLPVLIKALNAREKMGLSDLAQCIADYGKNSISLASSILRGNKRIQQQ
jgi:PTS system mannose-specific IIA component